MNSRQRFRETMALGSPDRIPYFEEGVREEVLAVWRKQGLPPGKTPDSLFPTDHREEIQPDLDPRPPLARYPSDAKDLSGFERRLDPNDTDRLALNGSGTTDALCRNRCVKMLRVHRGFFLSMGVGDWPRFSTLFQ